MINASETQPPKLRQGNIINIGETIAPGNIKTGEQSVILVPGESVADSYIISSLMDSRGTQSNVYLAKKWGKTYVVKIYHNGWRPSDQMRCFLTNIRHPNIAHVIECGDHGDNYYEIYDYYPEGTLEEAGALSATHIQNVIIPSINEGLHELHINDIVHCDIKPGNLFYSDSGKKVVIGDCGISGYTNTNGKLIDAVRGTPEYAPRVKALLWSAALSPAYDYGSFGLVLCKAVTGHSLFEGMSVEEISGAWENGLELPGSISGRIGILIKGLLNEDEEQRWGYAQVKSWCEGEYTRPTGRSIYENVNRKKEDRPLIFGKIDNQIVSVSTLYQLSNAIKDNWLLAKNIVKRRELVEFVRQFDSTHIEEIKELAKYHDMDAAVYKLLLYIQDDPLKIYYCGREYDSLSDYIECLQTGKDEVAKKFLSSGLLVYYLRYNHFEKLQVDKLEQLIRRSGTDSMAGISTICFALQGKKSIDIFGESVDSLYSLVSVLYKCSIQEIDDLLNSDIFIAWMNRMGYEKEMRKMKEEFH